MTMTRSSSSAWVRGVAEMFDAEGIDVDALFKDAGLDIAVLNDPAGQISIDDVSVLWEMAVARSGNTALGLSKELAVRFGNLGVVRYAMMACPTLLTALEQLVRYINVVSSATTCSLTAEADGCWFELDHQGGRRPVPRQRVEFAMLAVLSFCSWITGRKLHTTVVEFVHPALPTMPRSHAEAFECPVRFGSSTNRAFLSKFDLALPLAARDPAMATLHQRLAEDELDRLEGARTSSQVRTLLAARMPRPEPRREHIALALKISDRTLQRRLHAEGTSFQQLLDGTRRDLAEQYLRTSRNSLQHVSELLGFVDQSNLFRACKRWFGESPGQFRARFVVPGESDAGRPRSGLRPAADCGVHDRHPA